MSMSPLFFRRLRRWTLSLLALMGIGLAVTRADNITFTVNPSGAGTILVFNK